MQQQAPDPRLREALGLHQAGRLDEAEAAYRNILDAAPDQLDALQLLGVLFGQTGRLEQAHDMLSRAAAIRPGDANINYNLGECCRQLGRTQAAIEAFSAALAAAPNYADAAVGLAGQQLQDGQAAEAIALCRTVLARVPNDPRLYNQLGSALLDTGDVAGAREQFERALELAPDYVTARRNLAAALLRLGDLPPALDLLRALIQEEQDSVDLLYLAALTLGQTGQQAEALPLLQRILALEPDNVDAVAALARAHRSLANMEQAIESYRRVLELAPDNATHWARWADMLARLSRLDEARDALDRALSLDPDDALAALVGAHLARRAGDNDAAYAQITALAERDIEPHFNASVRYELGMICEAVGRYDEAFQAFTEANAGRASNWQVASLSPEIFPKFIKELSEYFADDGLVSQFAAWADAVPDDDLPTPYFLVGFPRSGTTLVERLLDAHPDIVATDELNMVDATAKFLREVTGRADAYPASLDDLDAAALRQLRQRYWDYLRDHHPDPLDGRRLIDKQPFNINHLGLICRTFPEARVLVALRDPRDACISCFANDFAPNWPTVQFLEFERTARCYAGMMALWQRYREILPLQTHVYRYEDLVASPREVLGGIVDFLGVPWHDDLLEGGRDSAGSFISTPSYEAVVQPINTRAVARWQNYTDQLAPVMPILQPFIEDFGYAETPDTDIAQSN